MTSIWSKQLTLALGYLDRRGCRLESISLLPCMCFLLLPHSIKRIKFPLCHLQAVMASDFAISRFKHLKKLLLVHGHWCYTRLANMIIYFFYKNVVSVLHPDALLSKLTSCNDSSFNRLCLICFSGLRKPAVLVSVLLRILCHCHDWLLADDFLQPFLHLSATHNVWNHGQRYLSGDAAGCARAVQDWTGWRG